MVARIANTINLFLPSNQILLHFAGSCTPLDIPALQFGLVQGENVTENIAAWRAKFSTTWHWLRQTGTVARFVAEGLAGPVDDKQGNVAVGLEEG